MKFTEVPIEKQRFTLVLFNKSKYEISGITKKAIMESKSQFVELERGDIINKAQIVEITANLEATRDELQRLTPETLKLLQES